MKEGRKLSKRYWFLLLSSILVVLVTIIPLAYTLNVERNLSGLSISNGYNNYTYSHNFINQSSIQAGQNIVYGNSDAIAYFQNETKSYFNSSCALTGNYYSELKWFQFGIFYNFSGQLASSLHANSVLATLTAYVNGSVYQYAGISQLVIPSNNSLYNLSPASKASGTGVGQLSYSYKTTFPNTLGNGVRYLFGISEGRDAFFNLNLYYPHFPYIMTIVLTLVLEGKGFQISNEISFYVTDSGGKNV